jgi:hypothetical protein
MSAHDYRVNAVVRHHLVSRSVNLAALQVGTTNGVVYILGRLETTIDDPERHLAEARHEPAETRTLRLAMQLEREVRRIRDVRDIVFKLQNVAKRGGRWRLTAASGGERDAGALPDGNESGGDPSGRTAAMPEKGRS